MSKNKNAAPTARQVYNSEYRAWINMLHRCHNPAHKNYSDYGGRGISVCSAWRDYATGFEQFLADMGAKPVGDYSLERIDNNLPVGYCPQNCTWADRKTQQLNRRKPRLYSLNFGLGHDNRRSPLIRYEGRVQALSKWADELGIARPTLRQRLLRGMSIEEAFTTENCRKFKTHGVLQQITIH